MDSFNYPANALPQGYKIENYIIKSVLGVGGFGITYLAEDVQLKTKVAIKEYLPSDLAVRGNTLLKSSDSNPSQLQPKSQADKETYLWGLERFLNEAQAVASLKHPNIVQVKHFFEANNTAYFVMDYEEGEALNKLLKKGERVEEDEIYKLTMPLLDGLKKVHSKHYLHRDISPSNIYIQDDGDNPILIDFGAARQSLVGKSHSMSSIIKVGYAPYEQYQTRGNQGPWSDIYAFGAVLYQLISGSVPLESTERINAIVNNSPDPLTPALEIGKGKYSKKLLRAIDWALNVREKDRPQSVDEWLEALQGKKAVLKTKVNVLEQAKPIKDKRVKLLYLISGLLVISSLVFAGWFFTKEDSDTSLSTSLVQPTMTTIDEKNKPTKEEGTASQVEPKNNSIVEEEIILENPPPEEEESMTENKGNTTVIDQPKSELQKLEMACNKNIMKACYAAALRLDEGKTVKQNYPKAKKYYEKACSSRIDKACLMLGLMYGQGHGVKQSYNKAASFYKKACDGGLDQGCEIYDAIKPVLKKDKKLKQGTHKSSTKIQKLEMNCNKGTMKACYQAALMFQVGKVVKQDLPKAKKYFSKACANRFDEACLMIGSMYLQGLGVKQNDYKAASFFKKACDSGLSEGCEKYNLMKPLLKQSPEDKKLNAQKLVALCNKGTMKACYPAALQSDDASVVKQSFSKARKYYEKTCASGNGESCYMLGLIYGNGHGVKQSYKKAGSLIKKACDTGLTQACKHYKEIQPLL